MFGKKRRRPDCRIIAQNADGAVLLDVPAAQFQLPDAVTVALSIEFFNDPQPCEIHRAAVRWRAVQQLQESCPKDEDIPLASMDEALRRLFPGGTHHIRLTEERA